MSDFPLNKLLQICSTRGKKYDKNVLVNVSVRVQTMLTNISICLLPQYQRQRKCFFFRVRAEKGIAQHIDMSSMV